MDICKERTRDYQVPILMSYDQWAIRWMEEIKKPYIALSQKQFNAYFLLNNCSINYNPYTIPNLNS